MNLLLRLPTSLVLFCFVFLHQVCNHDRLCLCMIANVTVSLYLCIYCLFVCVYRERDELEKELDRDWTKQQNQVQRFLEQVRVMMGNIASTKG
jgi:hypothetical protein